MNFMNNYGQQQMQPQMQMPSPMPMTQRWNLPHYESPPLNGRADANNFSIGPNSSIWLPDANEDIIWWIRTDNMGNKSITSWDVSPHKERGPVDYDALEARLANVEEWINAKQNKSNAKRANPTANAAAVQPIATE